MQENKNTEKEKIVDSFNEFFATTIITKKTESEVTKMTLDKKFENERIKWTNKVRSLSIQLKDIKKVADLQTYLYTERQIAVEYYHYLVSLLIRINKVYKSKWAERWEYYTYKSQSRYPNESEKKTKISSDLKDIIEKRSHLDNHLKFMESTIKTIDNIIFGIKARVEIEQISRGK